MLSGNLLKSRVSEICVNQGVGIFHLIGTSNNTLKNGLPIIYHQFEVLFEQSVLSKIIIPFP